MADVQEEATLFGVDPIEWAIVPEGDVFGFSWKKFTRGIKRKARSVSRAAKKIAKNPLVKVAATGLAFVVPPAGAAIAAAVTASKIAGQANNIVRAASGVLGPKKKAAARSVVGNTVAMAKAGDVGAMRAVAALRASKAAKGRLRPKRAPANRRPVRRRATRKQAATPRTVRVSCPSYPTATGRVTWEVLANGKVRRVS